MAVSTVDNICYNNPNFEGKNVGIIKASLVTEQAFVGPPSTQKQKDDNLKFSNKIKYLNSNQMYRIFQNTMYKHESIIRGMYFIICIVVIIVMSRIIDVSKTVNGKKLTCNICGDGEEAHYFHTKFGDYWGERCDKANHIQSSYTCKENSACLNVEITVSSDSKVRIENYKKRFHEKNKNITWDKYWKRSKRWLNTWFPRTIKGCIRGAGHSWVRNECHSFNSSVWDLQRISRRQKNESQWRFVKTCVCNKDNCN